MLVPSGIYTDQGSTVLRSLFLNHCHWETLFGFINNERIFDIHSQFKFVVLLIEKGGTTQILKAVFNRRALVDLEHPNSVLLDISRKQIEQFSPKSLAIIEPHSERDIDVLEKLYSHDTVLVGDQSKYSWQLQYTREFNMTDDHALFPPRPKWETQDYQPDAYGNWKDPYGNIALPLCEGRMVGPFDPSRKGWVSGKGRSAVWREIPFEDKVFEPQYLMSLQNYVEYQGALKGIKIIFMNIGSATNTRSMYAALTGNVPCVESVPTIQATENNIRNLLSLVACLNSFTYDYSARCRLGGLHLSYFVIAETPLVPPSRLCSTPCAQFAAHLNLIMPCFASQWLELRSIYSELGEQHWHKLWAITHHERLRLRCILDAIIAELYGLQYEDFVWILRDDPTNPKGFWRVDKEKPKELRQTTLALAAFKRLKEVGLEFFCQEDWQFPSEIGAQLGPRFTAWQEQGTIAESWAECEEHAQRMKEISIPLSEKKQKVRGDGKDGQDKAAQRAQLDLWSI